VKAKPTERVVVVLVIALVSSIGPAEVRDANAPQTLQEYLRQAARNNAGLKAAFEEWKAALEAVPQAKALPDPRFSYGYFIDEVETRVGPQKHRLGIMQVFPGLHDRGPHGSGLGGRPGRSQTLRGQEAATVLRCQGRIPRVRLPPEAPRDRPREPRSGAAL
jgi:hypothetical protein